MGQHDETKSQHESGMDRRQGQGGMDQGGSPSGGMEQGTSQVGTHGNEQGMGTGFDQTTGGGYGQDSGFEQTTGGGSSEPSGGVGQPSGGDDGRGSVGGAQQGDMTTDPTRSGNTGWGDRTDQESEDDRSSR